MYMQQDIKHKDNPMTIIAYLVQTHETWGGVKHVTWVPNLPPASSQRKKKQRKQNTILKIHGKRRFNSNECSQLLKAILINQSFKLFSLVKTIKMFLFILSNGRRVCSIYCIRQHGSVQVIKDVVFHVISESKDNGNDRPFTAIYIYIFNVKIRKYICNCIVF